MLKKMKKCMAFLLILCMAVTATACGGNTDNSAAVNENTASSTDANKNTDTDTNTGSETDENAASGEELPRFKILFAYQQYEDKLGGEFKSAIQYLCDAYNCEAVFYESGSGDTAVGNLESVLTAGDIDGLISVGFDTARMEVASKYNVPVVLACGFPSVEAEVSGITSYDLFLGGVTDSDYRAGYRAMESLYEVGCRQVTYSGLSAGFAKSHDDRTKGVMDFLEANPDMILLADSYTMGKASEDIPTFNASFPEIEGMAFTSMSDALYNAIESEDLADGSVKIAGVDISSKTGEFFERGIQVWGCGGQYGTAMVSWAILYNYLIDGTRIISDTTTPIERDYLEITTYEEFEDFVKYVGVSLPVYDAEEIKELIHYFNPDITYEGYLSHAENYTLQDIIERHGDKIND